MKIDDLVPEDHLLRLVDRCVDFSFAKDKVKHLYGHTGPSLYRLFGSLSKGIGLRVL